MITNTDKLANALGNTASRLVTDKASLSNMVAGTYGSLWRATGQPGQGAIPTASAVCTKALVGSYQWPNQVDPNKTYMGWATMTSANAASTLEIHDRLAHNGGLVLNSTSLQALPLNLANLGVAADRIGDTNYSDVQWWLEFYSDGGATASNGTVNVLYNDGSSGALSVVAVGGTMRASRMLPLNSLIPAAKSGLYIAELTSIQLSASTGTAGNFGFTATRPRTIMPLNVANKAEVFNWAELGFPDIANDACLFGIMLCPTTTTGTLRGSIKLAHG